jgi:hypothetical protein
MYSYNRVKQKRPNINDSTITILMCSVYFQWKGFWQERNDLLDEYSVSCCCRIHCISLPLKSFTIRIFVQFRITTLMLRLNGNVQNVQNITEAVQCPRQPTNSTARFIYSIPNHDHCYHYNCRGLPSLSQPIFPALFLLSVHQLISTENLQASSRIVSNYSNQQIHKKRTKNHTQRIKWQHVSAPRRHFQEIQSTKVCRHQHINLGNSLIKC